MENQAKADVVVIGAGVIGMACAYELSKKGLRVLVIDRGEPGFGCSYGNAGWMTPCFAMPLPMPGMFLKSLGWLLDPVSPLYIKPEPSLILLRWLSRFLVSMNRPQMMRSVKALTEISKFSLSEYERLHREFSGAFGFEQKGLLMVAQTRSGMKAAIHEMELVAPHGIPGKILSPGEVRELDPAISGGLEGAVYFPSEAHGEPLAVVKTLAEAAKKHGTQIHAGTEVFDFETEGKRLVSLRTTRGSIRADRFVLATGSWSASLARRLRLRVPVLGGKGYAIVVKKFEFAPRVPIMVIEKKVAITPRSDSVRLAGTLELVNQDDSITPRRVDAILAGARGVLPVPECPEVLEIWRGLRPCTPDGVPMIGYSREYENLMLATGHQMLGLQSAPGTGRLVAELMTGAPPTFDPAPFRPERF